MPRKPHKPSVPSSCLTSKAPPAGCTPKSRAAPWVCAVMPCPSPAAEYKEYSDVFAESAYDQLQDAEPNEFWSVAQRRWVDRLLCWRKLFWSLVTGQVYWKNFGSFRHMKSTRNLIRQLQRGWLNCANLKCNGTSAWAKLDSAKELRFSSWSKSIRI